MPEVLGMARQSPSPDNILTTNDPISSMVRADFFSFPVFMMFCLFYIFDDRRYWRKNLAFLGAICLLAANLHLNLSFAKTHLLGFTAENKLLERVTARIQEQPEFNPQTLYTVIQAGELPLRGKYYHPRPSEQFGYYTLQVPYSRHWIAFEYYNFYAPENFVREGTSVSPAHITQQMSAYLSSRTSAWPSPEAVFVDLQYALIALTPDGRKLLTGQFDLLRRQLP